MKHDLKEEVLGLELEDFTYVGIGALES